MAALIRSSFIRPFMTTLFFLLILSYPMAHSLGADAVAIPNIELITGTYVSTQFTIVTCTTPGATIRYTKDGTRPTSTSPSITSGGVISIPYSMTLTIRAFKSGMTASSPVAAFYTIVVEKPSFSMARGTYGTPLKVTLGCPTPNATIYYTTNGTAPSSTSSKVVAGSTITLSKSANLQAFASKSKCQRSEVVSTEYTLIETVSTPVFNLPAGTYYGFKNVTITCSTPGAAIHYTTNGIEPTEEDPVVASGSSVYLNTTSVLRAKAWKEGMYQSATRSVSYIIPPPVETPVLSLPSGAYVSTQAVTVTCATPGATIRYTTNGTTPTSLSPSISSGKILNVTYSMTLTTRAFKTGMTPSPSLAASYTITVAQPTFSVLSGTYANPLKIKLNCPTPSATIYYTTNGTIPGATSSKVIAGTTITLSKSATLQAYASKSKCQRSEVAMTDYTLLSPVSTPTFNLVAGTYNGPQNITAKSLTSGAVIHYTTNGIEPTEEDPILASGTSVYLDKTTVLKAKAWKEGMYPSPTRSVTYTIPLPLETPVISLPSGSYISTQITSVTCPIPDATIRYTTDGTTPTTSSPAVGSSGQLTISKSVTLKVRAWKSGWKTSPVATTSYIITVAAPVFDPEGGFIDSSQAITVTCSTPGAVIRYTKDGKEPTSSSPTITNGAKIRITKETHLKARAWKTGCTTSSTTSALFTPASIVVTPDISLPSGTYFSDQQVTLSCSTPEAVIHYTTNGSDPTEADPIIASGASLEVNTSMTLKVRAWRAGYIASSVRSATYTLQTAMPSINLPSGTYFQEQQAIVTCVSPNAVMHYTTTGAEPTESDPIIASGDTLAINRSMTLKVKAWRGGYMASSVLSTTYSLETATPDISLPSGTYFQDQPVFVSCNTPNAVLRYTTNGIDPTESDPVIEPFTILQLTRSMTFKVKAWKTSFSDSPVRSATYTFQAATPDISLQDGTYFEDKETTVSCLTPGATMHYTTNGIDPTEADPVITSEDILTFNGPITLKVNAWKENYTESPVRTGVYTFQVATPEFSLPTGIYPSSQTVTVTCTTPGAVIYYTIDGTEPTESSSNIQSGATVIIPSDMTLKAKAWKGSYTPSNTRSAAYTITGIVATPTFSPEEGIFNTIQNVTIACTTPGAIVRYTLDGSDPNPSSTVYNGTPIRISSQTELRAKAWKIDWQPSTVQSAIYVVDTTILLLKDANLEAVVREAIAKPTGPIRSADVINLTTLVAYRRNIMDLDGIGALSSLVHLDLTGNKIANLSPLSGMNHLRELILDDNRILDISPLGSLTNLQQLKLNDNHLQDITPLRSLTRLNHLELVENLIHNFSPLTVLVNLEYLSLNSMYIEDPVFLTPLTKLRHLELRWCNTHVIDAIAGLTPLTYLDLSGNEFHSIEKLSGLSNLVTLKLNSCDFRDVSPLKTLSNLEHLELNYNRLINLHELSILTKLKYLDLSVCEIRDISFLSYLTELNQLYLDGNHIRELDGLSSLTKLVELHLDTNRISGLSDISSLLTLKILSVKNNRLEIISPLKCLINLEELDLSSNTKIMDIDGLNQMTQLKKLRLNWMNLKSGDFLTPLTNLIQLHLENNDDILDLNFLNDLTNLQDLDISSNDFTDVAPLQRLTNLISLDLSSNPMTNPEVLSSLTHLKKLILGYNNLNGNIGFISALTNLEELDLGSNQITSLSPLANLLKLQVLSIGSNSLSSLNGLQTLFCLEELWVSLNQVNDISALTGLTQLRQIYMLNNSISNLQALSGLTNLRFLEVGNNPVTDISPVRHLLSIRTLNLSKIPCRDFSPISGIPTLHSVSLSDNELTNLSFMTDLVSLEGCNLENNLLTNLGPLENLPCFNYIDLSNNPLGNSLVVAGLTGLRSLSIDQAGLTETQGLSGLTRLHFLLISNNSLNSLGGLTGLSHLTALMMNQCSLGNLSNLQNLNHLETLYMSENSIADLAPLSGLTELDDLYIPNNQIADLAPLNSLVYLRNIDLSHNQISSISGLNMPFVKDLDLDYNLISDISVLTSLPNLFSVDLYGNLQLQTDEGTPAYAVIMSLKARGCSVSYNW